MKKYYPSTLPKRTFHCLVLIFRIFGLFPFRFNESEKRFSLSIALFIYSIVALVFYAYFIGLYYWSTLWSVLSQPAQYNVFLLFVSLVAAYCGVIVNKLTILVFATEFQRILNDFCQLWNYLHSGHEERLDRKLLNRLLFKLIVIDGIGIVGSSGTRLVQASLEHKTIHFYNALYGAFNFSMEAIVTNVVIAVAYLGGHFFRVINFKIILLHQQLQSLGKTCCKAGRQPEYEKMSIELSGLMLCHERVNQAVLKFMQLNDASMLLMQFKYFVVIIMSVFIACVTTVNDLRKNQTPSYGISFYLTVLSVFNFLQFYYLVTSTSLVTSRGAKTGRIVDFIAEQEHEHGLDVKIHAFSLELLHRDNKIYTLGLYPVDFSLVYSSFASMVNYLIVSIQFQILEFE